MNGFLSYPSLKIILEHLEANKRFQLAERCPSIRKTERLVPLHIDNLCFQESNCMEPVEIHVNSTKYKIGTIVLGPENILSRYSYSNENGGASNVTREDVGDVTEGDVAVPEIAPPDLDQAVTQTQLTIEYPNGRTIIQRNDEKLWRKEKQLTTYLFGNRKTIIVKRFEVHRFTNLRLPIGFKLNIRKLIYDGPEIEMLTVAQKLSDSRHFNNIEMKYLGNYLPQSIQDAHQLTLRIVDDSQFLNFQKLKNKTIILTYSGLLPEQYISCIKQWKEERRPLGTSCYFCYIPPEMYKQVWSTIKEKLTELNGNRIGKRCLSFPMTESTELRLSFQEETVPFVSHLNDYMIKWEVVACQN